MRYFAKIFFLISQTFMRNFAKMNLTGSENDAEFHEKQNETVLLEIKKFSAKFKILAKLFLPSLKTLIET